MDIAQRLADDSGNIYRSGTSAHHGDQAQGRVVRHYSERLLAFKAAELIAVPDDKPTWRYWARILDRALRAEVAG